MRDNIPFAVVIQFMAWVILVLSLIVEPLSSSLIPIAENTPAFLVAASLLLPCLIAANLLGFLLHRLLKKYKISATRWNPALHALVSVLHIAAVSGLIYWAVGFEDL